MFAACSHEAVVYFAAFFGESIYITGCRRCDQSFIKKLGLRALQLDRISFSFAAQLVNVHLRLALDLDQQPRCPWTQIDTSTFHYRRHVTTPHVAIGEYGEPTE